MATPYDRALDAFSTELAGELLRVFRNASNVTPEQHAALTRAIVSRDKPAIRRILGGADLRLEHDILEATTRVAGKHLPAIAGNEAARRALEGMTQSATRALVSGASDGIALTINLGASRSRYESWHLLNAIGLTEKQTRLYFATIRAAQDIAKSIPRHNATAEAIRVAAQVAAQNLPPNVARQLAPILRDPANQRAADAAIRALSERLRQHHAGPVAHVAAHSLIEAARLQEVKGGIASGKLPTSLRKRWTNPLDELTRSSHADATYANTSVPVDEPFITPWGELDTPPPPGRDAYHCRCRAEYFIPTDHDKSPAP